MKPASRMFISAFIILVLFAVSAQLAASQPRTDQSSPLMSEIRRMERMVDLRLQQLSAARNRKIAQPIPAGPMQSLDHRFPVQAAEMQLMQLEKKAGALTLRQRTKVLNRIGRLRVKLDKLAERSRQYERWKAAQERAAKRAERKARKEMRESRKANAVALRTQQSPAQQARARKQEWIKKHEDHKAELRLKKQIAGNLPLSGGIAGRVTDSQTGSGIESAEIDIYDEYGDWITSAYTDAAGNYIANGLDAGTYFAQTNISDNHVNELYDNIVCQPPWSCEPASGTPITVLDGQTTPNISFALDPGGSIAGKVTDEQTGQPIAWAGVNVYDAGGDYVAYGYTDSYGDYVTEYYDPLATGNYYAISSAHDNVHFDELYNNLPCPSNCNPTTGTSIPVTAGNTTTKINFSLPKGGTISGTITDSVGNGLDGGVRVYDSGGQVVSYGYVQYGQYTAGPLQSGDYYIATAVEPGYINELYDNIICHPVGECDPLTGNPVAVTVGNDTPNIDFVLVRGGSISGHVTDAVNGAPISNAEVDVFGSSGDYIGYGYTDSSGFYTVVGLLPGTYYAMTDVFSWPPGNYLNELYDNIPCEPSYSCDPTTGTPINVVISTDTPGIDFALDRLGSVSGDVTDATTGAGIPNVDVDVYNAAGSTVGWGYTDESGHYVASGLQTGTYYVATDVSLEAPQYVDVLYENVLCPYWENCDVTSGTPVSVTMGVDTPNINLAIPKGGAISGWITDASGSPLAEVGLSIVDSSGNDLYYTEASTDAYGYYEVVGLVTGNYYLATESQPPYLNELYNDFVCPPDSCNMLLGTPVTVTIGNITPGIDFALGLGGSITGRITDSATGAPISGIEVGVYSFSGNWLTDTITSATGIYTLSGLASGNYYVRTNVNWTGANYINEVYDNIQCSPYVCDPTVGTPIAVVAGAETPNINFALDPGGWITGTVTDAVTGNPVYGDVYIYDSIGQLQDSAYIDDNGFYAVKGLTTGSYYAEKYAPWYDRTYVDEIYDNVHCDGSCDVTSGTVIPVVQGDETPGIDFALDRGGSISGHITDPLGAPLEDVTVFAFDQSGGAAGSGYTDQSGNYTVEGLADGPHFVVTWGYSPYSNELYDNIACAGCDVTGGTPIPVALGTDTPGIDFSLEIGGTISGTVTDAVTGAGISNIYLYLYNSVGNAIRSIGTDSAGHYTSYGLPTGQYYAIAIGRYGGDPLYMDQLYNNITCQPECNVLSGQAIDVTIGSDTPGINFALQKGGTISGTVIDAATTLGLPSATVDIYDATGNWKAPAYMDGLGHYTSLVVPPGTNYAVASANGFASQLYDSMPCDGCDPTAGTPITVVAETTTPGIDFALSPSSNRPPISNSDHYTANWNTTLVVPPPGVLVNDLDPDLDPLTAVLDSTTANGTLALSADGSFTYSPNAAFVGEDSFIYHANDGTNDGAIVTVTITVAGANEPPVGVNDAYATGGDALTIAAPGVLGNDTDANGDPLTAVPEATTTHGTLVFNTDGSFQYTPNAGYMGSDSFTYHPFDGTVAGNTATVTIAVNEACLFCDDFEDGSMTENWTIIKPAWTETGGELAGKPVGRKALVLASSIFSGCDICTVESQVMTEGGPYNKIWMLGWYGDKRNAIELLIKEENDKVVLRQRVNGVIVSKAKGGVPITPGIPMNVAIGYNGTAFTVTVDGASLLTLQPTASVPVGTVGFAAKNTTVHAAYLTVKP